MVGKKDFDNIALSIAGAVMLAGTVTQSIEIDLDIPRGFIAKVYEIEMMFLETAEDFEFFVAEGNNVVHLLMGVIADPDDTVNILTTSNRVLHDVMAEYSADFWADIGGVDPQGSNGVVLDYKKTVSVPEHIDEILARNPRLNAAAAGGAAAQVTETIAKCIIRYTLERVTDADILNLLDIL